VIDQSLAADGFLFATHRDRALYLREAAWKRPQWLKENKGKWRLAGKAPRSGRQAQRMAPLGSGSGRTGDEEVGASYCEHVARRL
jgi:hypothetical protein